MSIEGEGTIRTRLDDDGARLDDDERLDAPRSQQSVLYLLRECEQCEEKTVIREDGRSERNDGW